MQNKQLELKTDYDPMVDGVTQSLLTAWKDCPSKARAKVMGLYKPGGASKALMFGSVYHAYDDIIRKWYTSKSYINVNQFDQPGFNMGLEAEVRKEFEKEYLNATADGKSVIDESFLLAKIVFPQYMRHWNDDFFGTKKEWVEVEGEFKVRVAGGLFRGKRDGVYRNKDMKGTFLYETKTKSRWNDETIMAMLPMDFQVLSYMLAYYLEHKIFLKGVLYNVVRKPQLRRGVNEDFTTYGKRIQVDMEKRPDFYFSRYYCAISEEDIKHFSRKFSKLTLDFYAWARGDMRLDEQNTSHCVNIYGNCQFLNYCSSKHNVLSGLDVKEKLFSELG